MRAANLREQTDEELRNLLDETQRELGSLNMLQRAGDGSKSPIRARNLRHDAARILTVLRERRASIGE